MEKQLDRIECEICSLDISSKRYAISRHIKKHEISFDDYIKRYYKLVDGKYDSCGFCDYNAIPDYEINHNNKEYRIFYPNGYFCGRNECKRDISVNILGEEYNPKKYEKIGSKSEYLMKLYKIDIQEAKNRKYREREVIWYNSLEDFRRLYGEEDGEIRYKKRLDGIIKNHAGNKFPCTLENFIKKYGEDLGTKKYNDRCERISYTSTIDFFIDKYGEIEGKERWVNKFRHIRISKGSLVISDMLNKIGLNFESEKNINGKFLDYYIPEYNMGIEYFGNYWHMNPKIYEKDVYNSRVKKTAEEIWDADKIRLNILLEKCDTIIVIWEASGIDLSILEKTINNFKFKKTIIYL